MGETDDISFKRTIYFSRRRPPKDRQDDRLLFRSEKNLKDFVIHNLDKIPGLEDLKEIDNQYPVKGGMIDILCRDTKNGDYVVIELKKRDADFGILQILHYMSKMEAEAKEKGVRVRGVVITGQPNAALKDLLGRHAGGFRIDWLLYTVSMSVEPI